VAGNVEGYSLLVRTGEPVWAIVLELSIVSMFASVFLLVRRFGLFSIKVERDRSLPFIQAAYSWSLVALALLFLAPVHDALIGVGFSHAYFGGYRHAFTVGFISMMILGVSSKVVPVLGGLDPHRLSSLRATFWLVNIGNSMRVVFQILTDTQQWAYPLMGLSAWLEVTGLVLWAVDLWRAMNNRPEAGEISGRVSIVPQTKVFDVIQSYPETAEVFRKFGFSMIDNPMAQRIFARSISIEQACRLKHVDFNVFASALNQAIGTSCDASGGLIQIADGHSQP
jgi:hypothetical protein